MSIIAVFSLPKFVWTSFGFFPFILDVMIFERKIRTRLDLLSILQSGGEIVGRTSRGVTQREGHTGFLIHIIPSTVLALIFLVRRIQPFLPLVDREVEFCVLTI